MHTRLLEALRYKFRSTKGRGQDWVLVIGDLMLDRYLWGAVERISPEAPVPVVLLDKESSRPGGAANVAANLSGLGLNCRLIGCVGEDDAGWHLTRAISESQVETSAIVRLPNWPTITKTRIVGGHQQMLRVDRESSTPFDVDELKRLNAAIHLSLQDSPAIIILSDYAKGVLHPEICRMVISRAKAANIPVLVDPKGRDYTKYRGATALTPNLRETSEVCGCIGSIEALLDAAAGLRRELELDFLAVTRSEEGISLIEQDSHLHIPAMAKQVFDVSGAGDTVIATLAAGLVAGLNHVDALHLANLAAGIVVGKVGTVPVGRDELLAELTVECLREQTGKICDLSRLLLLANHWRSAGQRIVFTCNCFDPLHAGHITYLEAARKLGDCLIVGLSTGCSMDGMKEMMCSAAIHEQDRARFIAALEVVDAVILFDEERPLKLIELVKPDVLVLEDDYTENQVFGDAEVTSWGGTVVLVPIFSGQSGRDMICRMR